MFKCHNKMCEAYCTTEKKPLYQFLLSTIAGISFTLSTTLSASVFIVNRKMTDHDII
jgi:hypothetical protein